MTGAAPAAAPHELATASRRELAALLAAPPPTPVVPVALDLGGTRRVVRLKLEGANPGGSIKMRTALGLVRALERAGRLGPGAELVESTSGNLGVALAAVARARRYRFTAVVDPKASPENVAAMAALGATVDRVAAPDAGGAYLLTRLRRVAELCRSRPGLVWTDQYSNPANPGTHERWTGPELVRQVGAPGAVFVAVSTCGTLVGLARHLRRACPATAIVAVDARGSAVFSDGVTPRRLNGIGSSRHPSFPLAGLVDAAEVVDDRTAFAHCRALRDATGLSVGGSSGAVLAACARYLAAHPEVTDAVCLCADRGEIYASTIFDDAWMAAQGLDAPLASVGPLRDLAPAPGRAA